MQQEQQQQGEGQKKEFCCCSEGIMSYRSGHVAELAPTSNIEYW
jgi:hypothetical protein